MQPGEILSLERIKTEKLPQAVIQEQRAAIRAAELERDNERSDKEAALLREQESLAREEASQLREKLKAEENEHLLKKLRDAGLEP